MKIYYLLLPLSVFMLLLAVLALRWAMGAGQFEDLDSPAHIPLHDDEDLRP